MFTYSPWARLAVSVGGQAPCFSHPRERSPGNLGVVFLGAGRAIVRGPAGSSAAAWRSWRSPPPTTASEFRVEQPRIDHRRFGDELLSGECGPLYGRHFLDRYASSSFRIFRRCASISARSFSHTPLSLAIAVAVWAHL